MSSTTPNASGASAEPAATTTTTTRSTAELIREIARQDDEQQARRAETVQDPVLRRLATARTLLAHRDHEVARGGSRDSLMFHWISDRIAELIGEALAIVHADEEDLRQACRAAARARAEAGLPSPPYSSPSARAPSSRPSRWDLGRLVSTLAAGRQAVEKCAKYNAWGTDATQWHSLNNLLAEHIRRNGDHARFDPVGISIRDARARVLREANTAWQSELPDEQGRPSSYLYSERVSHGGMQGHSTSVTGHNMHKPG
ncbi:hypothetical protein DPSP01_007227 [Paraphaeosphaeria sporulosa]